MTKSVHTKNLFSNKFGFALAGTLLAFLGNAQTYTTKQDGNWNSAATWVGGVVPSASIGSGKIVNINHDVTYNLSSDLSISGTLNIQNDTLRFGSSFDKKTKVNATGQLNITNGGYMQDLSAQKAEMEVYGRISIDRSLVTIGKTLTLKEGTKKLVKNSTLKIGETFELGGTTSAPARDTLYYTTLEVGFAKDGKFDVKSDAYLVAGNNKVFVNGGEFKVDTKGSVVLLPGSNNQLAFNVLKIGKNLENAGTWDARIDAFCIDGDIKGSQMGAIDFTRPEDCSLQPAGAPAPELSFQNPVLEKGTANQQGAVYRFANVIGGVDATIKVVRFSRSDIEMRNMDKTDMGWPKAFQPEFGLPGLVQPNQNWYVDFEIQFYEAGTNTKKTMSKVDLTALDVDGDGNSIKEYAVFQSPHSVTYSTVSYMGENVNILDGQSMPCPEDGISSPMKKCDLCGGDGKTGTWNWYTCDGCDGTGHVFSGCNHAYSSAFGNTAQGPVDNFINIDTAATQVMATYQYFNVDKIKFQYGARSGTRSSNGSGVRLNSVWFRQFSVLPPVSLPVKLSNFTAAYNNADVNLNWTGEQDQAFNHYVVQRSTDGKDYKNIATVIPKGSIAATTYAYKDVNVTSATGAVYYRLQLVDKTGEAMYSNVRTVRLAKEDIQTLTLAAYPNPVTDYVKVTLPQGWQGKAVKLELYNANGTKVSNNQFNGASQTETVQLSNLSKGFYIVKASCEGQTAQQRLVKN